MAKRREKKNDSPGSFTKRPNNTFYLTMSTKKSIADLAASDLKGKKVLVRCDLNVPLDGKTITDDTRIRSSIPTIEYLTKAGAIVTVCSHLGRPKEGPEDKFSLGPCGKLRLYQRLHWHFPLLIICLHTSFHILLD